MRDVLAGILAIVLVFVAISLVTTLQGFRRRRQRARDSERALGRAIIVEIPGGDDLILFSEDRARFYYGERSIDKDLVSAVHVLINGAPIASYVSKRHASPDAAVNLAAERGEGVPAKRVRGAGAPGVNDDHHIEGIARDRWDVAIDTV